MHRILASHSEHILHICIKLLFVICHKWLPDGKYNLFYMKDEMCHFFFFCIQHISYLSIFWFVSFDLLDPIMGVHKLLEFDWSFWFPWKCQTKIFTKTLMFLTRHSSWIQPPDSFWSVRQPVVDPFKIPPHCVDISGWESETLRLETRLT